MSVLPASASTPTLYGIRNCDTVKRARGWLEAHLVAYEFHDLKTQGVAGDKLAHWCEAVGWDTLINKKGTTWRKLDGATQASVVDAASAMAVMLSQPSIIKRPVVEWLCGSITVGFDFRVFGERADR